MMDSDSILEYFSLTWEDYGAEWEFMALLVVRTAVRQAAEPDDRIQPVSTLQLTRGISTTETTFLSLFFYL